MTQVAGSRILRITVHVLSRLANLDHSALVERLMEANAFLSFVAPQCTCNRPAYCTHVLRREIAELTRVTPQRSVWSRSSSADMIILVVQPMPVHGVCDRLPNHGW